MSPVSSSRFQSNNNDHIIDVNLGDRLNIVCPHYEDRTVPMSQWEYYLIYMVSSENYEVCVINDTHKKIPILNCTNPESKKFFTMLIFEFQPIPGIPDFQMGQNYYFITTSGGRLFNINNQYEGACKEHQMKMMLRVRPKTTDGVNNPPSNVNENNNHPTAQLKTTLTMTTTTTTTTLTTASTTATTEASKSTARRPSKNNPNDKTGEGDNVPGFDGFPNDDTVIHAGEGPNINSGIIADNGLESPGISLHRQHRHSVHCLYLIASVCFLISAVLSGR
ncbi:hypothetical protein BsWGS_08131 [Bradybaena similaris]